MLGTETDEDKDTLTVVVGEPDDEERKLEKIRKAERGEEVEPMRRLVLPSFDEFEVLARRTNLEILQALAKHDVESITELAGVVDRDYKEVHRNVKELATMNVVEFEEHGNAKKPVTRFGDIEVKILLDSSE
jgi:predicted transcriptional regulator